MRMLIPALMTLALVGCGDWGHGKDDVVEHCKSYATQDQCVADELCQWKEADPEEGKPARCKAK